MGPSTLTSGVLGNLDLQSIIQNLSSLVVPITQLVLAISFIGGLVFTFKGVIMLHHLGSSQSQASQPKGFTSPFIYITIGAVLMYMPATTNVFSVSMLGSNISSLFPSNDVIDIESGGNTFSVNVTAQYDQNASSELMQYVSLGIAQEWSSLINTIVLFIQLIGLIAFVRGWFILASVGSPGGAQQGAFSKGLIHIIGGVIAINFVAFMQAIGTIVFSSG